MNGALGHKFLENQISYKKERSPTKIETLEQNDNSSKNEKELNLSAKNTIAKAIQTDEGIVVLPGSEISEKQSKNYGYKTLREELIQDGTIQKVQNGRYVFMKKHLFSSPSAAAAVIVGSATNGRNAWKDKNGHSLNEIEKSEIK